MTRTIRTTYVHPPIPIRTSDWCACEEGQEEYGPYGWGATEAEAIEDLQERLEDEDTCPMCYSQLVEEYNYCRPCGEVVR
jgi:hypothetical protein